VITSQSKSGSGDMLVVWCANGNSTLTSGPGLPLTLNDSGLSSAGSEPVVKVLTGPYTGVPPVDATACQV